MQASLTPKPLLFPSTFLSEKWGALGIPTCTQGWR